MTLMVRDEADIIEDNLRYHRAQGVDFFVVADTGSSDGTLEILETCERAGILRLEKTPSRWRNAAEEGEIQTLISRVAWEMDADWVIHNDSDEFWWPLTGNLKEALASIPERFGLVLAPRTEFVGRPGDGFFADRLTVRETRFSHRERPIGRTRRFRSGPPIPSTSGLTGARPRARDWSGGRRCAPRRLTSRSGSSSRARATIPDRHPPFPDPVVRPIPQEGGARGRGGPIPGTRRRAARSRRRTSPESSSACTEASP